MAQAAEATLNELKEARIPNGRNTLKFHSVAEVVPLLRSKGFLKTLYAVCLQKHEVLLRTIPVRYKHFCPKCLFKWLDALKEFGAWYHQEHMAKLQEEVQQELRLVYEGSAIEELCKPEWMRHDSSSSAKGRLQAFKNQMKSKRARDEEPLRKAVQEKFSAIYDIRSLEETSEPECTF